MAGPILIQITGDATGVVTAADKAGGALQTLEADLATLSKKGAVSSTDLQQVLRQYTQTVGLETTKQSSYVKKGVQDQEDAVLVGTREVNKVQRESVKATGSAISQTVSQSVAGFDGTIEGALGSLSNLSAGLAAFSEVPGFAIAAGGVSIFASLLVGLFQQQQAETKAQQQATSDLTAELEKLGSKGVSSVANVNAKLKEFSTTTDQSDKDLSHIADTAKQAGVDFDTYARALAGNTKDQKALYDAVQKQIPALEQQVKVSGASRQGSVDASAAARKQLDGLEAVSKALTDQNASLKNSKTRVDELSSATEKAAQANQDYGSKSEAVFGDLASTIATQQATADQAAQDGSEKTKKKVIADNEETVANFIATQQAELSALVNKQANEIAIIAKFGDDAGKAVIKTAGDNPTLLAALAGAGPDDIAKIKANFAQAGQVAATNYVTAGNQQAKALGGVTIGSSIIPPDAGSIFRNAQTQLNTKTLKITADVFTRNGQRLT